jgi:hypothetical protein
VNCELDGLGLSPCRGERVFALLLSSPISSGTHPVSYPMDMRCSFPMVTATGAWADQPSPSRAEVKKVELYIHSSIRLLGIMHDYLSIRIALLSVTR